MKRLLIIICLTLLTSVLLAQKKSNYEKYWQAREDSINNSQTVVSDKPVEYDDLYYQPSKDNKNVKKQKINDVNQVVDTLIKYNSEIKVIYEYNYDPFFYSYNIGRFYHNGFNYWMYDSYDWYWEFRFMKNWYSPWYYNNFYFGYNYWSPWRYNYHYGNYGNINNRYSNSHNWNGRYGNINQRPEYGRRERPSTLSNTYNNNTQRVVPQEKRTTSPQNRATYQENRRTYTPSYENPRMGTRPQYNNSRIGVTTNRRVEINTQSRTYSAPTRSYNSGSFGNNRSSGSSSSSSGSGSSGGRSSGGSSTGRR